MKTTILANTDITIDFHGKCVWRSPGVMLRPNLLLTERLYVDFKDMAFISIVQLDNYKQRIFLN